MTHPYPFAVQYAGVEIVDVFAGAVATEESLLLLSSLSMTAAFADLKN